MIRHDPAKGGDEILTHALLWVKPAGMMPSGRSQTTKGHVVYNSIYVK